LEVKVISSGKKINTPHGAPDFALENTPSGEFNFSSSKIYALAGERGSGNTALSFLLTGWQKPHCADIRINSRNVTPKKLRMMSCYIGHGHYYDIFPFQKRLSVKRAIGNGLKKTGKADFTYEYIKEKFALTTERENRPLKYLGNEHWRASIAIGYAYGKSIYCSGFIEKPMWDKYYGIMLMEWLRMLSDEGALILLPTNDEALINSVADEVYSFG